MSNPILGDENSSPPATINNNNNNSNDLLALSSNTYNNNNSASSSNNNSNGGNHGAATPSSAVTSTSRTSRSSARRESSANNRSSSATGSSSSTSNNRSSTRATGASSSSDWRSVFGLSAVFPDCGRNHHQHHHHNNSSGGGRRSRSSRSSQAHFHRRLPHLPECIISFTNKNRNVYSATLSLLASILLVASLVDENWFQLEGGGCRLKHLGVTFFYRTGVFREIPLNDYINGKTQKRYHWEFRVGRHRYMDCSDPSTSDLFHGLMAILFVGVLTTFTSSCLQFSNPFGGFGGWLARNAVFSTFSVILSVVGIGIAFFTSEWIENLQMETASSDPDEVRVSYAEGFYLLTASAVLSLLATALTFYKSNRILQDEEDRLHLMSRQSSSASPSDLLTAATLDGRTIGSTPSLDLIFNIPPTPPYTINQSL